MRISKKLFRNPHQQPLPPQGKNIRWLSIVGFLFILFVFNCCGEANTNAGKNETQGTINPAVPDTTINPDSAVRDSDSVLVMLRRSQKIYTGDFDTMLKRRIVRVLVPYSRTLFFNDKGKEHGITADNFREFEDFLNQKYKKQLHNIPFTVAFIPTPRDRLYSNVIKGLGDIAAGNLTATEERLQQVDFVAPKEQGSVREIVLNRKQDAPVNTAEQLSGKTVYVRKSSSYFESLQALNATLSAKSEKPVNINFMPEELEDEDLMEMLDAGIIPLVVVDDWMAKMWAQILPNIRLNEAFINSGGYIGCAFRKNSPVLTAELKDFYYRYEKKLASMPYRLKKYYQNVKELQDPTKSDNAKHFREIVKLFEKYGKQYDFDPLMLAAQGFQESKLNQNQRSAAGAIGVMQVMPKTGRAMKVGDITITEPNIHAGTKYMNTIITTYFHDAHFDNFNKSLFAFASYNAGPNRIEGLRKLAANYGLNPDVWLNNVEIVASEKIGLETTTYVRNIVKYYYSYKLMADLSEKERKKKKER
jgi:membrane-bound lytic murein transglycosylase MltF